MLLFIQLPSTLSDSSSVISIHLMLLFIKDYKHLSYRRIRFQYISCYCLSLFYCSLSAVHCISIHLMLLFILAYPCADSHHCSISIHLMLLFIKALIEKGWVSMIFQYISCYCLSVRCADGCYFVFISIHLMLLFIQKQHRDILIRKDFNTSHVTVYPPQSRSSFNVFNISIHLMLLFIYCLFLWL